MPASGRKNSAALSGLLLKFLLFHDVIHLMFELTLRHCQTPHYPGFLPAGRTWTTIIGALQQGHLKTGLGRIAVILI